MDGQEVVSALPAVDDSLDDFFAKKDKSKRGKKKRSKYVTTEALAKTLEKGNLFFSDEHGVIEVSTGAEEEEPPKQIRKDKESSVSDKGTDATDTEEWHEFEDESQRDYSDLKIQNFQISDAKPEETPEPLYNEEGELILPKEEEGPWKMQTKDKPDLAHIKKAEPAPEPAPPVKSVYRPPHARLSASPCILPGQARRRRNKDAPVINSEIDFPSLASAVQDTEQHVGFKTVKSGAKSMSRSQMQGSSKGNTLALDNQFEALRD